MPTVFSILIQELDRLNRPADCALRVWANGQAGAFNSMPEGPAKRIAEDRICKAMVRHPEWSIGSSLIGIKAMAALPTPEQRARAQLVYARHLINSDDPRVLHGVNSLIQTKGIEEVVDVRVLKVLQNFLETKGGRLRGLPTKHKLRLNLDNAPAPPEPLG